MERASSYLKGITIDTASLAGKVSSRASSSRRSSSSFELNLRWTRGPAIFPRNANVRECRFAHRFLLSPLTFQQIDRSASPHCEAPLKAEVC